MDVGKFNILIVDDDKEFIATLKNILSNIAPIVDIDEGYCEEDFYKKFNPDKYNVIILDLRLKKEHEGMELLKYALEKDPHAPIIVLTGYSSVKTAVDSFKIGARDYLEKQEYKKNRDKFIQEFQNKVKKIIIEDKARKSAEKQNLTSLTYFPYFGSDIKMRKVLEFTSMYAKKRISPVLLIGEYGTEKDDIAKFIYKESKAKGKFVKVVVDSKKDKISDKVLDQAKDGVLYISEVFNLEVKEKQKLIDILNFEEAARDKKKIQFVFATTELKDPSSFKSEIEREFYYRVRTPADITIPPLRERGEDIMDIAHYFLSLIKNQGIATVKIFSDDAKEKIKNYLWPDNLYELKQVVDSAAIRATGDKCEKIRESHLLLSGDYRFDSGQINLDMILADTYLKFLKMALEKTNYEKLDAYVLLGYKRSQRGTISRRIKDYFETYSEFKVKYEEIYKRYK